MAAEINKSNDTVMIFGDSPNLRERQFALEMLAEAEVRTNTTANAVTGYHENSGTTVIAFRNAQRTCAEVLEELRHLKYARTGHWNFELPGRFTANQCGSWTTPLISETCSATEKLLKRSSMKRSPIWSTT